MKRYDHLKTYCRMLGHEIPFEYCRESNQNLPCRKILDCWFERVKIRQFVDEIYSEEEKQTIFNPPKEKILTIFDLIEKAKKSCK
jgi:hypothetical protein